MGARYRIPSSTTVPWAEPEMVNWPLSARNAATLAMMSAYVTRGTLAAEPTERIRVTLVRCLEHSGQRMPTGVGVMQSGQMGRPQLEQATPVSREGWRSQVATGVGERSCGGG